ncbi:PKD domain-containing protein [Crocinitomix catalasitica]|uniref:PKD domain-containing protein n=1 Tax=Crocinitomix catalasitica TaxID=184607 RepID=UPI000481C54D|nr:PKD domain-containing protein [Crocinitomix catalasitica]
MRNAQKGIFLVLFITLTAINQNAFSQDWVFPYPTTGVPCFGCAPIGWTTLSGSTDISDLDDWISYTHYDEFGSASPVPEPTPGVTTFMSAMSSEAIETSFTVLEPRVLTIYFAGFGQNISGMGPVGAEPGPTINVLVNGASVDVPIPWDGEWHPITYDLVIGVNTILFDPGIGDDGSRHAAHISIPALQAAGCVDELVADIPVTEICIGEEITLSVSSINGGSITWEDDIENGVAFTPEAAGTFTYNATSDFEDDCPYSTEIIVHDLPEVNAGEDITICAGDEITLTGTGAETYEWSDGITDGIPFIPAATATYTVTGTSEFGCVNTDDVLVTIIETVPVDAGEDFAICIGDEIILSGDGAGIDGVYEWSDGVINEEEFIPVTTTTYTVIGTDINGCEGTDDILVTVNDLPLINAGDDQTICIGFSVTLSGDGAGIGGIYNWSDDVEDGIPFDPTVTNTYTVTGTDANGCIATDDVIVTINELPSIDAGPDQEICIEEGIVINGSGGGIGTTYTWSDGVIDGVMFSPTITKNYTVTGTDENGCVNTDEMNILVHPLPEVSFAADEFIGCAPFTVNFENDISSDSYLWNFGDGATSIVENPTHIYDRTGTFDITLTITSAAGCENTTSYNDYINVIDKPIADFSYEVGENSGGFTNVHFFNSSSFSESYNWTFDDGGISNLEHPENIYNTSNGRLNYQVQLIAENYLGCKDSILKEVIIDEALIYFIPNAFTPDGDTYNEYFTPVFTSGYDPYDFHMTIYNRWGEMIFESFNSAYGWNGTYGNLGIVESGIYIWKIEFGSSISDEKIYTEGTVTLLK